jgi:hypothetical protein
MAQLHPERSSNLGKLCAAYSLAKPRADEAAKQLEQIVDAIKVEMTNAVADDPAYQQGEPIVCLADVLATPLRLSYRKSWYLDVKSLKAQDPHTYVKWAKQRGVWQLAQVTT